MFGFIKKLITGILSFITGLLPGKKGNGYYLELDEAASDTAPETTDKQPEVAPVSRSNGSVAPVSGAVSTPVTTITTKVEEAKNGSAKKAEPTTASASNGITTPPVENTFAPKYLRTSGSGSNRRRPGANMNSYLDMARQMKTSNN
ncbi:hypothetical protein [Anabaenopsis elenkinii]|jgi:hypothetical protein|uniref:Uncharacterized protein n=1 Tax=Anabaenopsis elenkinii CCIBt3563 TaxID=2779889 RepID=A0A7S6RFW9_9CYAN|nr:hypothetical protein [Anabaenopsis elenkinii]QOV24139.1 hypothetical protein IM676_07795 [Anabaenopsis elenkinii CCIBt3563]